MNSNEIVKKQKNDNRMRIYFSENEKEKIKKEAERLHISFVKYVKNQALYGKIIVINLKEIDKISDEISQLSYSINQYIDQLISDCYWCPEDLILILKEEKKLKNEIRNLKKEIIHQLMFEKKEEGEANDCKNSV